MDGVEKCGELWGSETDVSNTAVETTANITAQLGSQIAKNP